MRFILATLLAVTVLGPAQAETFNAASDFSNTDNPNGQWSYGATETLGGPISLYTSHPNTGGYLGLDEWSFGPVPGITTALTAPFVIGMLAGASIDPNATGVAFSPDVLTLHPGGTYHPPFRYSVVRWTAPASGTYRIVGEFQSVDIIRGATTDVHILKNGAAVFDGVINGIGAATPFFFTQIVTSGDTIDFVVGEGADGQEHDSTGLSVVISNDPAQTVFFVHGIAQNGGEGGDLKNLAASLRDPVYGIDDSRFIVDAGFDFGYCADKPYYSGCHSPSDYCTIQNGARSLAVHINEKKPSGDIIIIGYSMGGLIARDMILHNYANVITNHHVAALITLGTPHLGYPYEPIDGDTSKVGPLARCDNLSGQMFGDFRNDASLAPPLPEVAKDASGKPARDFKDASGNMVAVSGYLYDLNTNWANQFFDGPDQWIAIAGSFCPNPRPAEHFVLLRSFTSRGCPVDTGADGVVCEQSAGINITGWPATPHFYTQYSHSADRGTLFLFGPTADSLPLFDPPKDGEVVRLIKDVINGLP